MSLDLCLLSDLKTRLRIPSSNTNDDTLLQQLIDETSDDFHEACGYVSMFTTSYVEAYDGNGRDFLRLNYGPIQSVTAVTMSGNPLTPSPDGVQPGYTFQVNSRRDWTLVQIGGHFWRGRRNVIVSYTAGYGPQTALPLTDPGFPSAIEMAVMEWCELRYKQIPQAGMTGKRLATGESVNYDKREMPPHVQAVIDRYKRVVAAYS